MTLIVRTLSDQLVELVRDRILSGQVPPDLPVRQDALANELGVSKIPLREAFARLEQDGLLVSRANRGFFVRPLSRTEAEEVYALRLKLEPEATVLAAERATDAERDFARETLATLYQRTSDHGAGVGAFNRAFHLALLRPSRQMVTIALLERLQVLSDRYVRKHLEPLGRSERADDEHRIIMDAWLARDSATLGRLITDHIQSTLDDLRQQLDVEDA
jgi:DNA-binding GntR family transcriptional regulator